MTNYAVSCEDILIGQQKIEKVTDIQIPRTNHTPYKTPLKKKYMPEFQSRVELFWKKQVKYSKINNSPFHLKNK